MSTPQPPANMRRRTSSVGQFTLGDNASPSLSTMPAGSRQARASRHRQKALGKTTQSSSKADIDLFKWIWFNFREFGYVNTWFFPLLAMLIFLSAFYLNPDHTTANPLHKFIFVSYAIPSDDGPTMYGKGVYDFTFVFFYIIFFTFFREFCMQVIIRPIAIWLGLRKSKLSRFMEQSYSVIYYALSGSFGLYVMKGTPLWYFNTTAMYDTPHKTHELLFKVFYLLQAAFWSQQSVLLALQVEKPRKDFKELVFHHIITITLIWTSYRFHFTWVGLAIYITMDVSDFFLSVSKNLNYLDHYLTGPFFVVFIGTWIYFRHYLNIKILYSILTEFETVGDFVLNWEAQQYKCWISQYISFCLLGSLQLVNLYWLFLILRIAYRFAIGGVAKDERSDDEEDEGLVDDSSSSEESRKNI
ncbi:longevity assurance proteins LAG1/LAC1 [Nadsonia fulvescens var. elongata DSM 6958]|uniref:Longevity assurance proteins LAG1/LAC1 n=1 Tax=Nadsonia fulvescens var. elongata DSM 6958 TaxID=857566 RepID=A0A1E3PGJ2_9ASCO|nr:longevity assurance proteins LAG1/LAC1 [Nadsonia fulvescens var. elongata DSM 6958]